MKIMFLNGAMTGQTMDLSPAGTTIGRESDNAIQLPMGGVSRYHARIECEAEDQWVIRDLGSTNGTLVDDVPVVGSTRLVNGAVISIGDQLLRCIDGEAAAGESLSAPAPTPQANSAPLQTGGQQPAFFFRPRNVAPTPSPVGSAPSPNPAPAPGPAVSSSAPTIQSVPTDVPKLFAKKENAPKKQDRRKKLLGNIIFAMVLLLAVLVALGIFYKLSDESQKPVTSKPVDEQPLNPFFLYYEKNSLSETDVFRFTLILEMKEMEAQDTPDGKPVRGYFMEVTLDEPQKDPENNRRYYESFMDPIPEELINKLKKEIDESGFMGLQQEKLSGGSSGSGESRRIAVGFDKKFCDVSVSGDVSETFSLAEEIIMSTLLEEYDLGGINEEAKKILKKANDFLLRGDEAFVAIELDHSRLGEAIANYRYALHLYRQFDPKPEGWAMANEGLKKAEEMRETILNDGRTNVKILKEQQRYKDAIDVCDQLLQYFPPDSDTYKNINKEKIELQNRISRRNK